MMPYCPSYKETFCRIHPTTSLTAHRKKKTGTLFTTGIRISECLALQRPDLTESESHPTITIRAGKSRAAERAIEIPPELATEPEEVNFYRRIMTMRASNEDH